MEHTFNLRQISAFKVTLDYKAARATQRNHISKKIKNKEKNNTKKGRKQAPNTEREKKKERYFPKKKKRRNQSGQWWHMPLIAALGKQRQTD